MDTTGRHLLAEYRGCDAPLLDDLPRVEALMARAAEAAGAVVVRSVFHTFSPHGVTGVVVIEESHLSIHTWPEAAYAAVDFFTCGDCDPYAAHRVLLEGLGASGSETLMIRRGLPADRGSALEVGSHERDDAPDAAPRGGP